MAISSEGFASPAGGDKGSTKTGMTSEDLARDGIREAATAAFERVDDSVHPHSHGHCTKRNRETQRRGTGKVHGAAQNRNCHKLTQRTNSLSI